MSITTSTRRRRRVAVATVVATLSVMGGAIAQHASADTDPNWVEIYRFRNQGNGRCLDMNPGVQDDRPGRITTYDCHGGSNQRWMFASGDHHTIAGASGYAIRSAWDSTKCLGADPYFDANSNGRPMITVPCNYLNEFALWDISYQDDFYSVRLRNVGASRANWWGNDAFVTFDRSTPGNFGNVYLWQDTGGSNQWFTRSYN
jgi:hypothetical protein